MSTEFKATVALIGATMIWGSSFVALKYAFATYHPFLVIFARMLVGSLCFILLFRLFKPISINKSDLKWLFLMSLFEPCLYFIFEAIAISNTTASSAGMITALHPLMVAFGAWMILKEKISKNMILGFLIAIAGVIWLSLNAQTNSYAPNPVYGNFMEFMAMIVATGYVLIVKHLSKKFDPFFLTAIQAFAGALFYAPVLLMPSVPFPGEFPLLPTLAVVYLGAVVTIGGYGLYNYGVSKIPASKASAFINLIPAFSVLFAFFILDERLGIDEFAAIGLIFLGVFVSEYRFKS